MMGFLIWVDLIDDLLVIDVGFYLWFNVVVDMVIFFGMGFMIRYGELMNIYRNLFDIVYFVLKFILIYI